MEEIWKSVKGYESIYEVSSVGRIRSLDRVIKKKGNRGSVYSLKLKGKILKPKLTKLGYHEHGLSNGVKYDISHFRLNRLVATAFIPNPNNLPQVHHIDHDKLNNKVDNLKWVTASENIKEAIKAGKHHGGFKLGLEHHNARFSDEQVEEMFMLESSGKLRSQIADIFKCSRPTVTGILNQTKRKRRFQLAA